jgi:hypothetical protein
MKKIILATLMIAMLATPCMAEVEPSTLFSIENTLWLIEGTSDLYYGFTGGIVYFCSTEGNSCLPLSNSSYVDFPLLGIFSYHGGSRIGYLSPLFGIGIAISSSSKDILLKVNDNWTPPSE